MPVKQRPLDAQEATDLWDLIGRLGGQVSQLDDRVNERLDAVIEAQRAQSRRIQRLERRDRMVSRVRRSHGLQAALISLAMGIASYLAARTETARPVRDAPSMQHPSAR